MGFEVPGSYVWDFWLARDREKFHLFYLTAPRTEAHHDLRHTEASIGHATSDDLKTWQNEGIVLRPSEGESWDDGTTWTGSVIQRPDGKWMMFYTGTRRSENYKYQRIGAAISDDLYHWEKLGNPLLEADPEHYETYDPQRWHDQAFRDPWVFPDPDGNGWRMIFTARDKHGLAGGAGVIGQARSTDLINWKLSEPLIRIGFYGEMEVPQLFALNGWWFCLFSNPAKHVEPTYRASGMSGNVTGTHYVRSRSPDGPFELVEHRFFAGDPVGHFYAGRVVQAPNGEMVFLAFLNQRSDGSFVGALTDPMPIWTTDDGYLRISGSQYGVTLPGELPAVGDS